MIFHKQCQVLLLDNGLKEKLGCADRIRYVLSSSFLFPTITSSVTKLSPRLGKTLPMIKSVRKLKY